MQLDHVWVKVNIGGTHYYFDPSYKPHTQKTGINLITASGYNASTYLTQAKTGATVTADYIQGVNRTNIRKAVRRNNQRVLRRMGKPTIRRSLAY